MTLDPAPAWRCIGIVLCSGCRFKDPPGGWFLAPSASVSAELVYSYAAVVIFAAGEFLISGIQASERAFLPYIEVAIFLYLSKGYEITC